MKSKNDKLIIETMEDIEKLEILADKAYDNEEYKKAADYYYEILIKVRTGYDVKKIAESCYLYGLSLCKANDYMKGIDALKESYELEYKINGGAENETTRAIREAIYEFYLEEQDKPYQPHINNEAVQDLGKIYSTRVIDTVLRDLFETYEKLKKKEDIDRYANLMKLRYEEIMEAPPYKVIRCSNSSKGEEWFNTEPDYVEWFLYKHSLCKFLEVTKDNERLIQLSEEYIRRWRFLLKKLDGSITNKAGIITEYLFGISDIGWAIYNLKMFNEASTFYSQCIQDLNTHGFCYCGGFILWIVYYQYAITLSEINRSYEGLEILQNCLSNMLKVTDDELKKANECYSKSNELGSIYKLLGDYYQYTLTDYKNAILMYEKAVGRGNFEAVPFLGKLYIINGQEKAKTLYQDILAKSNEIAIPSETIAVCMDRLGSIAKEELEYAEAIKLYEQLIKNTQDHFERQKYRVELYRCMAYAEVDTLEALKEVEKCFEQRNLFIKDESLDTIQDINALAAGYVSYANRLQEDDEKDAQEYMQRGREAYQKFFALSETLLEEAIRNNNRRNILPHIKEYDRAVQRYLELIEKDNINEMFECVIKYQSFAFEVDRLLSQKNPRSFKQDNIINKLKENLQEGDLIINYVLFFEKDIRRYGAFILQKDNLRFYKLGNEERIKDTIFTFKDALLDRNVGEEKFCHAREALLKELLPPIMLEEIKKVYVVKVHGLEGIPFHLITGIATSELVNVANYLIEHEKDLAYNSVTVFSNPEFEVESYETKVEKYIPLEGSKLEGNLIRRIYSDDNTKSYNGIYANVQQLRKTIKQSEADILHISSHHVKFYSEENGYMDSSKLVLAGANNLTKDKDFVNTYGEDGTISAAEISRIDMKKRLVVLAACKTGAGAIVEGGGLYGLSRAFYQHGCKVISTLYDIGDYPTAIFFQFFYENLRETNNPDSSLAYARERMQQLTRKELISIVKEWPDEEGRGRRKEYIREIKMSRDQHPYAAPYYWAGFIIGGR